METQRLLTTTRSVRKSLDLDAPVDRDDIRECLRTAVQAANGTNQQTGAGWLSLIGTPTRDNCALPRRLPPTGRRPARGRLHARRHSGSSSDVVHRMARRAHGAGTTVGHTLLQPYLPRVEGDESFFLATTYGSIFPAVWNLQLALHARGYGSCVTTLHLAHEARSVTCSGFRIPTSRDACCLSVACEPAKHSGRHHDDQLKRVVTVDGWDGRTHLRRP